MLTGAIYILKRNFIFGKKLDFQKITGIEIPQERSIDIDDANEFALAEILIKKR